MKLFVTVLSVFLLFSTITYANSGCYTSSEAEAEQGIRIHSELMVIALNCSHMANSNGENLYLQHQKFTSKHSALFAQYEQIIMAYMSKHGEAKPDKAMHLLRTNFANKVSGDVAQMRPDIFCRENAARIQKVSGMDEKTFRKWAATPFPDYPVSKPLCTN